MKITKDSPLYPITIITETHPVTGAPSKQDITLGITIRQRFAAMAMQGVVSTLKQDEALSEGLCNTIAKESVRMADALIAELNKES